MQPPEARNDAVTVEHALSLAIQCQKNGHLAEADDIYRAILEQAPAHAGAMHFAGVVAHQLGRHEEAVGLIANSLALAPDHADWHSNFGIVLKGLDRIEEAIAAFERAVALDPEHLNAHNNLGRVLYGQRRMKEAVACFCKVITLEPKNARALRLLAMAHSVIGEYDKAVAVCERWLAEEPDNPVARHTLASCSGRNVPSRAEDDYIETVFDNFAASFDKKLASLMYRAPWLVATMVEESAAEAGKTLDVLDAGCGTGLCGPLLTGYAARLVGVDLSAKMLDQARQRGVYDELVKGELTAHLASCCEAYDLIVSADTLVYFGALDEVVAAAARALRPEGSFVFTVEEIVGAPPGTDYCLRPHGRFTHAQAYVERLLAAAGLQPVIRRAELRLEAGAPVDGLVVRADKVLEKRDAAHDAHGSHFGVHHV
jgi:predicted TPR repeat methyltransferase